MLVDDINPQQMESIVKQHEHYGFATVAEVKSGTVKRAFTRLVYSESPIAPHILEALLRNNHAFLDEEGKAIRRNTAIAINNAVVNQLETAREDTGLEATVRDLDVTIQEEEPKGGYDRPTKEIISEGFKIDNEMNLEYNRAPETTRKRGRKG